MSQAVLENVLPQIDALEVKELHHLQSVINARLRAAAKERAALRGSLPAPPDFVARFIGEVPVKDRSREDEWLDKHRDEYAGQWVALDGDRLLGHGPRLKEVADAAKAAGVKDALFIHLEPKDALPFAGSQLCFLD